MNVIISSIALLLLPLAALANGSDTKHANKPKAAVLDKKTVAATATRPEFVQLARNVEVIPNIENAVKTSGLATHEGVFGALLFAEQTRAFFIELEPGMFLGEHPHALGSIVYTVRGKWVLASEDKRQVMEAGALFRFGDNMPTGWEAPFAEGALLLIVKVRKKGEDFESFAKGLKAMQGAVDKDFKGGAPFYFDQLKADHPAIAFARSVNPGFDAVLKGIKR